MLAIAHLVELLAAFLVSSIFVWDVFSVCSVFCKVSLDKTKLSFAVSMLSCSCCKLISEFFKLASAFCRIARLLACLIFVSKKT